MSPSTKPSRRTAAALAASLVLSTQVASQQPPTAAPPQTEQANDARPQRLIVRWQPTAVQVDRDQVRATVGGALTRRVDLVPGLEIWSVAHAARAATSLNGNPAVAYAEPDQLVSIDADPDDPLYSNQWGLRDIRAPQAWERVTSSNGTIVAVIDSGVDYTHPDLAANMWRNPGEVPGNGIDDDRNGFVDDVHGWDFANRDADPMDDHSHGTHVAGTIGAVGNNRLGVAGVAWNCRIMALKFLGANGSGWTSDAVLALDYAVANGARISNNSWGSYGSSRSLSDAIAAAGTTGHVFVAAAGNDGLDTDTYPHYPSSYPHDNIVSVAASDYGDRLAWFSNRGLRSVDVVAPGYSILSTLPGGSYGYKSGTSMAAPHVSGALALASAGCSNLIGTLKTRVRRIPAFQDVLATEGSLDLSWLDGGRFETRFVTGLNGTGNGWDFDVADWDRDGQPDLIGVLWSNPPSAPSQIHVLSGRSGFQRYLLNLNGGATRGAAWDFHFRDWDRDGLLDLIGILKNGTGSNSTEVHIVSGASSFQTPIVQTGTAFHETNDDWEFTLADWDRNGILDLIGVVKRNTGSGRTEVHVASGRSTFQTFIVHAATVFGPTDDDWEFEIADWNRDGRLDLVGLLKSGTGSNSTEVHVASGFTLFQTWIHQTGSPLPETNGDWTFALADWDHDGRPDLFGIHRHDTPTGRTELHIVDMPFQPVLYYGTGCGGPGNVPQLDVTPALLGSTYDAVVTGAVPSGYAFLIRSANASNFDLGLLGAPGCMLRADLHEITAVLADGAGNATIRMWIPPEPGLIGQPLHHQFFIPDPRATTSLKVSLTRAARTIVTCR